MNFSKINELKPYDLNCNIFDVYSYNGLSMQELLCQFFTKINECIKTSNETIDLASWLVNEGLKQEVALKLTSWLNDGTLENLINVTLFENLNKKIDGVSSHVEHVTKLVDENNGVDDTEKLQNAINNLGEFQELKLTRNYIVKTIYIRDKNNIRIYGGKISLLDNSKIQFEGTCNNVEIDNIIIVGVGDSARGIENNSGQFLNNIIIHDNVLKNLDLGISLNADLSGSYTNSKVYNNIIEDIKGSIPGMGYGIHLANTDNCEVFNNTVIRCGRHSIYHARGKNNKIYNNTIKEHRKLNTTNEYRSALCIFRDSVNVEVYGNKLLDCYDGGIHILADGDGVGSMYNINVHDNEVIDMRNNIACITVGLGDNIETYTMKNINIHNNKLCKTTNPKGLLIKVNRGINVNIYNNVLSYENVTGRVHALEIGGGFGVNQFDNIIIKNNTFIINGRYLSDARAIMYDDIANAENNILIEKNKYVNWLGDNQCNYIKIDTGSSVTNKNILNYDEFNIYYSNSEDGIIPNKYHLRGDKYIFFKANSGGAYEKLCISNGNPGTWRTISVVGEV